MCVALTPVSSGFDCSLNGPFDFFLLMHPFIKEIRHHGHLRQTALAVNLLFARGSQSEEICLRERLALNGSEQLFIESK